MSASLTNLFLQGRLDTGLCPHVNLRYYPNNSLFPKIPVLSCSATRKAIWIYVSHTKYQHTKLRFTTGEWKSLQKLCKILKYYEQDCSFVLVYISPWLSGKINWLCNMNSTNFQHRCFNFKTNISYYLCEMRERIVFLYSDYERWKYFSQTECSKSFPNPVCLELCIAI